jgi:S1-C subfamily serine protease
MRRSSLLALSLGLLLLPRSLGAEERASSEDLWVAAAARYEASTVRIRASHFRGGGRWRGAAAVEATAFYVGAGDRVATAASAVEHAGRVEVFLEGKWQRVHKVSVDADFGVAVFEATVAGPALEIDAASELEAGRTVLAAASGNAGGVDLALVAQRTRSGSERGMARLSRDLPDSALGTPVLGPDGRVRGIVSLRAPASQPRGAPQLYDISEAWRSLSAPTTSSTPSPVPVWPGYAVTPRSGLELHVLPGRRVARAVADLAELGKVRKSYLGLLLESEDGAVKRVLPDSPVAGKVLAGDRIVAVGERRFGPYDDVSLEILSLLPGVPVSLTVTRPEAGEVSVLVVPIERRGNAAARGAAAFGFETMPLTPELRAWLGLSADDGGVMVSAVTLGSFAHRAGLQRGQRLVRLAGQALATADDVAAAADDALRALAAGERVEAVVVDSPGAPERTLPLLP